MSALDGVSVLERLVTVHALVAAIDTGIVGSVVDGPVSSAALSERHGLQPEAVNRVVGLLHADGLVERRAGGWEASRSLRAAAEELPQGLSLLVAGMAKLPEYLRTGRAVADHPVHDDYPSVVGRLRHLFADAAEELAECLDHEVDTVLDLGTGSGVFGVAVARHHEASRLVGYDRADVLPQFDDHVAQTGMEETAVSLAGDFLRETLPGGFDCTLICNVLRILSADDARLLVERALATLADEGRLVIVDVMGDDPPDLAFRRSMYRLDLALRHGSEGPHDDEQLLSWIEDAGAEIERRVRLERAPLGEEALIVRSAA